MRKLIIISVSLMLTFFSSLVYSAEGLYGRLDIGVAIVSDSDLTDPILAPGFTFEIESDAGVTFGGALGYDFGSFRVEGEVGYQVNDFDKIGTLGVSLDLTGDVSVLSFLVNGYYDINTNTAFTPYISAGLGFANVEFDGFNIPGSGVPDTSDDDTVFAYQIGAGIGYAVTEKVTIDANYRFFGTSDPEFGTTESEFTSHNIFLGIRFNL